MQTQAAKRRGKSLLVLTKPLVEILKTIYFYRYMTAVDVTNLLYSPTSLTHVRSMLTMLAGGEDHKINEYLYRFRLPAAAGNREMVFTLGSRGRDFLASELGMPASWHYRPEKVRHTSYNQVAHALFLTRFLVAAHLWSKRQSEFRLVNTRISYQLADTRSRAAPAKSSGRRKSEPVC